MFLQKHYFAPAMHATPRIYYNYLPLSSVCIEIQESSESREFGTLHFLRESRFETLDTQKGKSIKFTFIDLSCQTRYSTYETESAFQVSRISKPYKVSNSSFENLKISFEPTPSLKASRGRKKLTIKYLFQLQPPICMNCLYSFSLSHT